MILPERLERLPDAIVTVGRGDGDDGSVVKGCAVELWTWLRGLPWSDRPSCLDPKIGSLVRTVNDSLADPTEFALAVAQLEIPAGDEAHALLDRLASRRLRETVLPLAPAWPDGIRDVVSDAVSQVIAALETGSAAPRSVAESAARSAAESAAWPVAESAARSGAESAAWAARSAAVSVAESAAWSATWSATWSAESAESAESSGAWSAEATRIIEELTR